EWQGEADVAFYHVAHVRQPVAELQGALDTHTKGEARVLLRVDSRGDEDVGVDHAAATPLDPAGAALLVLEPDVHLSGRLREWEVVRADTSLRVRAEQRLREVVQGALEVGHGQALVHGQPLDLVEDR